DPVAAAVCAMMVMATVWTGTASELMGTLAEAVGERAAKSKSWPDNPRALAGRLRRAANSLRKIGIEISFGREGHSRTRTIHISTTHPENTETRPSAPSASSAPGPKSNPANGFTPPKLRTIANDADDNGAQTVRAKALNHNEEDGADGADAKVAHCSAVGESGPRWSRRL